MTKTVSREEQKAVIMPPIRGFNTYDPPHHLPEGQGVAAYNVEIEEAQGVNKRNGFTFLNTQTYILPKYSAGSIASITGAMVYGSGTNWTNVLSASDVFYMCGNSSAYYWPIETIVGSATISLAAAYTYTATAGSYVIAPSNVNNLVRYKYGTTQKLMAFAGSDGYVFNGSSFAVIAAALTSGPAVDATIFQDVIYFCNGYEFKSYNGSSVGSISGTPDPADPKYIEVYTIGNANFLWIGGSNTAAKRSKFAFGDVNTASVWPVTNVYYAGDRDGTEITGGKPIPGGMAILKEYSIYVFSGIPGSGSLRKVVDGIGCVSPKSLVAYKNACYFLGRDGSQLGVFRFNGNSIEKISQCIEPSLNALSQSSTSLAKYCAEIHDGKYILSSRSSTGSKNDTHFSCYIDRPFGFNNLIYYPWITGNRGVNCLLSYEEGATLKLYSGSPTNGFVLVEDNGHIDSTLDNLYNTSTAIDAYADTGWLDFGDNSRKKELLRAYMDATSSGNWYLAFKIATDFDLIGANSYNVSLSAGLLLWSSVVYLSTPWQSSVDKAVTEVSINYPTIAKFFKFRWANANASEYFTVYPTVCYYKWEQR